MRQILRALLLLTFMACVFAPRSALAAQTAAEACTALAKDPANIAKFAELPDAPTTILTARIIPAGGDGSIIEKDFPEICRVEGEIAPTVGFLLRLPTKNWNGRFMMGGCGGPCGEYLTDRMDPMLVRNYAVANTDMGHKGGGWMFGYNNVQGMIDFGYRSTHVTTVASKEIVAAFYGKKSNYNYYRGCSTGGRQGLVEAQRFPEDFDGIVAGAPPWSQTGFQPYVYGWEARANTGSDGKPILTADKLPIIHKAVMEACDAADGLKDGILQDPRQCKWDPAQIQCKAGAGSECLTADQVTVVKKYYEGPVNSKGYKLFFGMPKGSELQWKLPTNSKVENTMSNYLSFYYAPGPDYSTGAQFDYDRDPARLALQDQFFYHTNPDLRRLKESGAKLILYHGWEDDNNIPPDAAIDYYQTVTKLMGGEAQTNDFFRLFMAPGMHHCKYGPGGGEADWTQAIENWVEKGQAPDSVIAYHMTKEPYPEVERPINDPGQPHMVTLMPRWPLPSGSYDRARPIYAFPDVAKWSGKGDPNDPATWEKAPR